MTTKEQFLTKSQRYQPISLPKGFSDEEMAKDWTLSENDEEEIRKYSKNFRLFVAVQLCAVRLYGRFLNQVHDLSPQIVNYLGRQLELPPSLSIEIPDRKATYTKHRRGILNFLGFQKFDGIAQEQLKIWIKQQARLGILPEELFHKAERRLLDSRILLPGPSILERLIVHACSETHTELFESIFQRLSPGLLKTIDRILIAPEGEQRSLFYQLKEYPPAASISSIQSYLKRYRIVSESGIDNFEIQAFQPAFLDYLFKLAKRYDTFDLQRFADHKRYALMIGFLLESRKTLLDHLVMMHDQYIVEMCRKSKNTYEKKHRDFRKRQKKAIDVVLHATDLILDWSPDRPLSKNKLWRQLDEDNLKSSLEDLRKFKRLEERGYGDLLLARYPSLRKYFTDFIHLPFAAQRGNDNLIEGIEIIRKLDSGTLNRIPEDAPTTFVPKELRRALKDHGSINRNAWETGLALAIRGIAEEPPKMTNLGLVCPKSLFQMVF